MKTLYKVGDRVWHKSKQQYGVITSVFSMGEEPRYYVRHSGFTWSVPEGALDSKKPEIRTQGKPVLRLIKNPKTPGLDPDDAA